MQPASRTLTGLAAALCLSAAAVSSAHAAGTDLESRVNRIESQTLVELLTRIDRLQDEVQQLRGQIEEQTHTIDGLQQRQKDIYLELDGRLRKLEQGGAASPPAAGSGDNAGTPPPAGDNRTPPAAGTSESAAVAPPAASGATATPPPSGTSEGAAVTPPPATGAGATAGGSADNAQAAYQQSFDLLKNGQYPQAIRGFHDFLGHYPDSALANNAQYWIGEANYVSRDYPAALTEFRKVIDRYPNSSKVPDALLKIGFIHYQQSNWDKARAAFNQVKTRYPASSAARLADERLRKMKQEGH